MILGPYLREPRSPVVLGGSGVAALADATYDPRVHMGILTPKEYAERAYRLVSGIDRCEVYLTDPGANIIGAVVMTRIDDIHYGEVAAPVTLMLIPRVRNDRDTLRRVREMIELAVKALGCRYYYTVKHTAPGVQMHRLREVQHG